MFLKNNVMVIAVPKLLRLIENKFANCSERDKRRVFCYFRKCLQNISLGGVAGAVASSPLAELGVVRSKPEYR
jgi:hypothetical protein